MVMISRMSLPDWSADDDSEKEAKCRKHPIPSKKALKEKWNEDHPDEAMELDDPRWITHRELQNAIELADPFFYDEEEAAHICRGTYDGRVCPFRNHCLEIALVNNESIGAFGSLTTLQRKWVRKNVPQFLYALNDATGEPLKDRKGNKIIERHVWKHPEDWLHLVPSHDSLDPNTESDDDEENDEE